MPVLMAPHLAAASTAKLIRVAVSIAKPMSKVPSSNSSIGLRLLTILGVGVGWLVGGANADTRRVVALFTVALVLASQGFDDPRVEIMVIVAAVVGLLIVLPVCWVWGMRPVASG